MKKVIYFIRHSEVLKGINNSFNNDSVQESNEKNILSINGERMAEEVSKADEFSNIDLVISSNYVRAMATAKYFVERNKCDFLVTDIFSERKHGVSSWDELPQGFEEKQFNDFDFKVGNGEALNEVRDRMLKGLNMVLDTVEGERIVVVSHATCIASMLSNWCDINWGEPYKYNNKIILDHKWNYLECFKLEFEDNKLVDISNLNI